MGQAAFGEAVLKKLLEDGVEIAGVSAPAPAGDRKDPLWATAEAANLPLVATPALKSPEGQAEWAALNAELCVMAFVTDIIPNAVLKLPPKGTIQYHPSLLPLHRGSSAMNWPIINGETETGLSVFWPDQGIDTGPILLQKTCPIGPDQTMGDLYFNHLFGMGVDALAESVALVAAGQSPTHRPGPPALDLRAALRRRPRPHPLVQAGRCHLQPHPRLQPGPRRRRHLRRTRIQDLRWPPDRPAGTRHARPRPPHRRRRASTSASTAASSASSASKPKARKESAQASGRRTLGWR